MYKLIDWQFYKTELVSNETILSELNKNSDNKIKYKLQLEDTNLWKPTCKKIKLNPKKASETIPQAWENNWNWYYNFEWALLEAKTLWKKIPTKEQWQELINNNKEELLKLPKLGNRHYSNAHYYSQGTHGYYWYSSPNSVYGYYVYINSTQVYPLNVNFRAYGFSVRCLKN